MTQDNICKKLFKIFESDDTGALQQFLDEGLDVNFTDSFQKTLLYKAAYLGAVDCLQVLLHAGADIMQRDEDNQTPLHAAAACWRFNY